MRSPQSKGGGRSTLHPLNTEGNYGWWHALTFTEAVEVKLPKTIPTEKARQGRRGLQVLLVLVCALILVGVVWFGVEFYGEAIDTNSTGAQSVPAQSD